MVDLFVDNFDNSAFRSMNFNSMRELPSFSGCKELSIMYVQIFMFRISKSTHCCNDLKVFRASWI